MQRWSSRRERMRGLCVGGRVWFADRKAASNRTRKPSRLKSIWSSTARSCSINPSRANICSYVGDHPTDYSHNRYNEQRCRPQAMVQDISPGGTWLSNSNELKRLSELLVLLRLFVMRTKYRFARQNFVFSDRKISVCFGKLMYSCGAEERGDYARSSCLFQRWHRSFQQNCRVQGHYSRKLSGIQSVIVGMSDFYEVHLCSVR